MSLIKSLGKNPTGKRLERIKQSSNYKNNAFQNLSPTAQLAEDSSFLKLGKQSMNKPKTVEPNRILPFVKTDLNRLQADEPVIVWFGHSSYLIKINGKTILVDPVFSGNASPVSFMIKAFKGANEYSVDDMPEIDLLLLTHDHYDHLDYKTLTKLRPKVKQVVTSLGVGSHLEYWGFEETVITELDWWESHAFTSEITITAAPGRHFTGRSVVRSKTLWSSYILKTNTHNLYLGGDSGYDTHFKTIGEKFGPFDIALLESGQYNTAWPFIHMMPEQTVQASIDLKANILFPIHWGKFALAFHDWDEPITRVLKKAKELDVKTTTPMIGEPLILSKFSETKAWWKFY
jgi:L-ascorbate metabolism protein UlaG (beta-lactamase superfamily)